MLERTPPNKCDNCKKPFPVDLHIVSLDVGTPKALFFCTVSCKTNARKSIRQAKEKRTKARQTLEKPKNRRHRKKSNRIEQVLSNVIKQDLGYTTVYNTRLQSGQIATANGNYIYLCTSGTPDRMFADTVLVFIEIKKPGGKTTIEQKKVANTLNRNGALVFEVDSFEQYQKLRKLLKRHEGRLQAASAVIRNVYKDIEKEL